MLLLSEDSAGKSAGEKRLQLRRKLLEKMESSAVGQKRFWSKVKKKSPDDCWEWVGSRQEGYGVMLVLGFNFRAHRISYFFKHRNIPENLCVCHRCDNPSCVNPAHLFLGTSSENRKDCVLKTRHARGEGQHKHKLTEKEVSEIRSLHSLSGLSYDKLAIRFKVSKQTIYRVVNAFSWKHVPYKKNVSQMNKDPLEKNIEKRVCTFAQSLGILCYKFVSPARAHVPDRVFVLPGGRVFWIEFKRKGKHPTPAQRVEIGKLQKQGATVYVIDNVEDGKRAVEEAIRGYAPTDLLEGY